MAVSVPKRLFRKAVDRNLLKRRTREAYRLNKQLLYEFLNSRDEKLHVLFQYTQKELMDFQGIEEGILKGFERIKSELGKKPSSPDDGPATQTH